MTPLLAVLVGTDVHPFDRLISWVGDWLVDQGTTAPRCVIQYGASAAPDFPAEAMAYLPHDELTMLLDTATMVVTHGGPATITECRRATRLPIVVPRDPSRGEHVDGHQQRFAEMFAEKDLIRRVTDEAGLRAALDEAMLDPESFRVATPAEQAEEERVPEPVRAVGTIVEALIDRRARPERGGALAEPRPATTRLPVPLPRSGSRDQDPGRDIPVVFVGGIGRSGSTLLDRMLGEMPDVCAVGEVVHLWERGLRDGERCGCGHPFPQCPFWTAVGQHAFGGWDNVDQGRLTYLRDRVDRTRHVPLMAMPKLPKDFHRDLVEYAEHYRRVYAGIRSVSGCTTVVDSSKHASLAAVLRWTEGIDLKVVHLVRDSRGVAYSWAKHVRRPDVVDGEQWMAQSSARSISAQWMGQNGSFHLLDAAGVPVLRERYEDLVADPGRALQRIRDFAGLSADESMLSFLNGTTASLASSHTVSGNPMRFRSGETRITSDDAWRTELPSDARRTVSAMTLPLRVRYGYVKGAR